jgi:two-component system, cell cycle sensor histidine kinase and response regulator CckA
VSHRYRVLYAEDNPHDADLTRAHFAREAQDWDLEIVGNGQACLDRVARGGLDLVLLDHRLPDFEGLDVLRALVHGGSSLPVVLVTGSGDEELVVKALRLGAANYVPKAGDYLQTLPQLLRQVVEEHRQNPRLGLSAAGPRRILYVEHHPMDIDLTVRHFAEVAPHLTLELARSCNEALTRLGGTPAYDAMLIDLRMPEQSGLDFVREAKRRGLPLPPFIMISGKGDEDAAIASLSLGAADYVAKRDGYLDQLPYTIDRAIVHDRLDRANRQLQAELAERKRVEVELRFRNVILSTQQETTLDGILVVDGTGTIVSSNRRFAEIWGIPPDILASRDEERSLQSVVDQVADPDGFLQRVRQIYAHPETKSEDEIAFKDGRTIERYSAPMLGADGELLGRVWYFRDITARKQAEKERVRLEEQLRQSQKMEALGSLAGGVAHDFNNLLSVILSYTDFSLEKLPEADQSRDDLLQVRKAATSAATLVRQLLAFSRKQVLQPVPLNLNQVVSGIEKMLRRVLGEDIALSKDLAPDLGLTMADPGQIEQVLMNLAVNARDAMPEGGRLAIATRNIEVDERYAGDLGGMPTGPYVLLTVADTGCGMDESIKARIFEPFFTTKGLGKGTGLGLPTVFGIVTQSGGSIGVESEPGKGARFGIYLPRELSASAAWTAPPARTPTPVHGGETILLVDDEDDLRGVAARALEESGYRVLVAANGEEALQVAEHYAYDVHLLLTDVAMPKMNGRDLAEELLKRRPAVRVVYVSGYSDSAFVQSVLDEGGDCLTKPYVASDLPLKVREVLDRRKSATTIPATAGVMSPDMQGRLTQATIAARHDEICRILGELRPIAPQLAAALQELADRFDYVGIRGLLH